jgi:ribosome maturation factor RimP
VGAVRPAFFIFGACTAGESAVGRKEEVLDKVRAIAEPLAAAEGLELVDVEFGGGGGRTTLRVFLDRVAGSVPSAAEVPAAAAGLPRQGVTLDDCANLSRVLSAALDVEDPIIGAYDLEVSSPGLDRPLRTPQHFERFRGSKVRLKAFGPIPECGGLKTFVGKLVGYQDGKVSVDVDGKLYAVPHGQIAKANVEYEFEPQEH